MLDYLPYTGCCYEWNSLELVAQPPAPYPDYWVHTSFACGSERILKSFRIDYTSPQFPPSVCVLIFFFYVYMISLCLSNIYSLCTKFKTRALVYFSVYIC